MVEISHASIKLSVSFRFRTFLSKSLYVVFEINIENNFFDDYGNPESPLETVLPSLSGNVTRILPEVSLITFLQQAITSSLYHTD